MPLLLVTTLVLKFDSFAYAMGISPWLYLAAPVAGVAALAFFGSYREVFRFISARALMGGWFGVPVAVALLMLVNAVVVEAPAPTTAFAFYGVLVLLYLGASRLTLRTLLHFRRGKKELVAIYGAGSSGAQLVTALRDDGRYRPVAFLDDDRDLHGKVVAGVRVFAPRQLDYLIEQYEVSSVLLALPSQSRRQRQAVLKSLERHALHVKTVPDIGDIVAGHATVADVRDVDVADLLGRDAVEPNAALLVACIRGKAVMVTGAGGSIGSELCRQILRLSPRRLVLLEISEHALYQIERELRSVVALEGIDVELAGLLGNVNHRHRVQEIMHKYDVQTVYHAAAYKHVPIVEQNIIEGIRNNVLGTWYVAEAAIETGVETFVLISTDKAVNPANVMGATKRFAELTLQALQERSGGTRFCMVRFGNVLESSGSVVPLFREQIKRGGPVTVTHKDVIRYFMTIPEAAQLVLQAGAMAKGGDVFLLDMSEPMRIEELARRMISLMGFTVKDANSPDGDIEIVYTGLRPAEKLFEELLIGNNATGTEHPMIMRALEHYVPWSQLKVVLEEMVSALDSFECVVARDLLMRTVSEYVPASEIHDLVWMRSQRLGLTSAKVANLQSHRLRFSLQHNLN
jgi:FlaA1/EpsC-like NDP-sugar epimerase